MFTLWTSSCKRPTISSNILNLVDETLACDHSIEIFGALLSSGVVQYAEQVLTLKSVVETLVCDHSNKAIEQYFHTLLFIML